MNIALWILQILLALMFLFAGGTKLYFSAEQMAAMSPPGSIILPGLFIKFIGVCELLGALGLVLPGLLRIRRALTPLAAIGLLIIMIGAVVVSIMGTGVGSAAPALVIGLLCAFVFYGRKPWLTEG
jgi:uncharacterized membrane protein YphA (DoxX/SURF4 family)